MTLRHLLAFSCLAASCLVPLPVWAQDVAAADALFNKAVADMEAGRYAAACPALIESQRLDPRSGTLFTIATCHAKAGKIATAATYYEDYLRSVADLAGAARAKHADRMKIARAELDKLRPQIPTLKLVLPAAAPASTAHVRRDGTELSAASLGVALPIDPGEHVVTLEVPGRAPAEHRFTVDKGQAKVVELAVGAQMMGAGEVAPPAPSAPAAPAAPGNGQRIAAYAAGGAGAVLVVVGAITGGLALGKKGTVDSHCPGLVCDSTGTSAVSSGKTLGTVSTVGFVVGGAALATGVVLFLTAPRAPKTEGKTARWDAGIGAGPGAFSAHVKGVW